MPEPSTSVGPIGLCYLAFKSANGIYSNLTDTLSIQQLWFSKSRLSYCKSVLSTLIGLWCLSVSKCGFVVKRSRHSCGCYDVLTAGLKKSFLTSEELPHIMSLIRLLGSLQWLFFNHSGFLSTVHYSHVFCLHPGIIPVP